MKYKRCVDIMIEKFDVSFGAIYSREFFSKKEKADALSMTNDITKSFRNVLSDVNWMDSATKDYAYKKVLPFYVLIPNSVPIS